MERSLPFVLKGAGLLPVEAVVDVPILRVDTWTPGQPSEERGTQDTRPSGAVADLFYFWMADCVPCRDGLSELARLDADPALRDVLRARLVVVDADVSTFFGNDLVASGWRRETLVDTAGGFSERLGVLGSPGVILSDAGGRVVARFNGEIAFDSPGFELLLAKLKSLHSNAETRDNSGYISLARELATDVKEPNGVGAKFLGVPTVGYFLLFALVVVCYAMAKPVMRLRKKSE
jgi:hypothetical protein